MALQDFWYVSLRQDIAALELIHVLLPFDLDTLFNVLGQDFSSDVSPPTPVFKIPVIVLLCEI